MAVASAVASAAALATTRGCARASGRSPSSAQHPNTSPSLLTRVLSAPAWPSRSRSFARACACAAAAALVWLPSPSVLLLLLLLPSCAAAALVRCCRPRVRGRWVCGSSTWLLYVAQHAAIRASILQDIHKQYIVWQSLKALKYMHTAKLLHRDMKPSNLLLNSDCLMKVADFGLARSMHDLDEGYSSEQSQHQMTDYVATRWYRAPEILLGSTIYGYGVDMWGLGCILGEILMGKPIFPGSSTINQLETIMELTGMPDETLMRNISPYASSMIQSCSNPRLPPYSGAQMLDGADDATRLRWTTKFPHASAEALDLLYQLLHIDPAKRITAIDALAHPYVATFHDESVERSAAQEVTVPIADTEKKSTAVYRERLYHEVTKAKRGAAPQPPRSDRGGYEAGA